MKMSERITEEYFNRAQPGISAYKFEPGVKERLIEIIDHEWTSELDSKKLESKLHEALAHNQQDFYDTESALRWLALNQPEDAKMVLESIVHRHKTGYSK